MNMKKKTIKQCDKDIKETLEKLIRRSKDGISMIEKIDNYYNMMGQLADDENKSQDLINEIEKRKLMKQDLTNSLNMYLEMYRERFGEYKEKLK